MSEICKNLWNKLNEYKEFLVKLDKENLQDTFKDYPVFNNCCYKNS